MRFTRNVGNITMDLNGVERINVNALGGADNITVNDLTGTDVTEVNIDLAGSAAAGDGAADQVIVNGRNARDVVDVVGSARLCQRDRAAGASDIEPGRAGRSARRSIRFGGNDLIRRGDPASRSDPADD